MEGGDAKMVLAIEVAKAEGARNRRDMPTKMSELYPDIETNGQFFKRLRNLRQKRMEEAGGAKKGKGIKK